MRGDSLIELHDNLVSGVGKIKYPSEVVWKSVAAALIASAFFWGSPCAAVLGFTIGLPAVLASGDFMCFPIIDSNKDYKCADES